VPKQDLHPELSLEQEFERWLAHARDWVAGNATLILLVVVAAVIAAAAVGFSVNAGKSARLSIIKTISEAETAARKAQELSDEEGATAMSAVLEELEDVCVRAEDTNLHAYALMTAANIHYDSGRYETALSLYDQLVTEHGENYFGRPARLAMGAALEALDRWADARKVYEEIVSASEGTFYAQRAADRLEALAAPPASMPAPVPGSIPTKESTNS